MRGDRVEIVVDVGNGVRTFDVVARRAGRRVETSTSRAVLEVSEVTRTGTVVRTARFMTSRVVAVVEHPAIDRDQLVDLGVERGDREARPAGVESRDPWTP